MASYDRLLETLLSFFSCNRHIHLSYIRIDQRTGLNMWGGVDERLYQWAAMDHACSIRKRKSHPVNPARIRMTMIEVMLKAYLHHDY